MVLQSRTRHADDRLHHVLFALREAGMRVTPQWEAVVRALVANDWHPSVESLHSQVRVEHRAMSKATVYKTLGILEASGEELEFGKAGNHYDGLRPYPHPHLVCTVCGDIEDFRSGSLVDALEHNSGTNRVPLEPL